MRKSHPSFTSNVIVTNLLTGSVHSHSKGRAARAGRIGFCWGLVDPEELPYMVELHLFLGRRLATAWKEHETHDKNEDDNGITNDDGKDDLDIKEKGKWMTYTLAEMTPDMVHYGSVPESILSAEIESVRRVMDSEMTGSEQAETMKALAKVCTNAMKQYRRTRPEASREAVRRAKAILEGERMETGQRLLQGDIVGGGSGGGGIPPHPLLRGMELKRYYESKNLPGNDDRPALDDLDNRLKRDEFLRAMSNFRPKETVFEAFATGGGRKKDSGIVSHVDKGRTTSTKHQSDSVALKAMKNMRRQMRMSRDKGSALVVAGSATALERQGESVEPCITEEEMGVGDSLPNRGEDKGVNRGDETQQQSRDRPVDSSIKRSTQTPVESKPRMSRADRKRLKKNGLGAAPSSSDTNRILKQKKTDYRDHAFFIDNDITSNTEEAQRQRQVEAAMQPSSSSGAIKGSMGAAIRIEEAMLDIVGDESDQLVQRQRMMRWDKSKRKYVQTTVGAELSGESRSKKLRLESGQLVKSDKMKLGELYEKWQKKTNRSVGRDGVFDDPENENDLEGMPPSVSKGRRGGSGSSKSNKKEEKVKSAAAIKADRLQKQDNKIKNMKRADRKRLEQSQKTRGGGVKGGQAKGYQGKKGVSGRWGSGQKGKK